MGLLAIPNISEGRDQSLIEALVSAAESAGASVLDVHSDPIHHRSVFTMSGGGDHLIQGLTALAMLVATNIDLTSHSGVHPRVGGLDVCPFVPHDSSMDEAVLAARATGAAIASETGLPVYLYGYASLRTHTSELSGLRRGGLRGVIERSRGGLHPDYGPRRIDPARGIVCVGARDVLIAFNIWVRGPIEAARRVAGQIRGRDGVRALGLEITPEVAQISMNLTRPDAKGIDAVFEEVVTLAGPVGLEVTSTEIVGLVPQRYLPNPDAKAARLLMAPGRSLESLLTR